MRYTRPMVRREPRRRLALRTAPVAGVAVATLLAAVLWLPSCTHGWDDFDPRLAGEGVGMGGNGGAGGAGNGPASGGNAPGSGGSSSSVSAGGGGGEAAVCGNGLIDTGEQCDDENTTAGDGCNDCQMECADAGDFLDPLTFHCYRLGPALGWQASVEHCAEWNGHLSAITSQGELDFVLEHVTKQVWLGASELEQEDDWVWVSGEPWSYAPWLTGEPNEGGSQGEGGAGGGRPYEEDCLELYDELGASEGFGFADDGCAHTQPPLCERWPKGDKR